MKFLLLKIPKYLQPKLLHHDLFQHRVFSFLLKASPAMSSIRDYFKPIHGLPHPNRSLSSRIPSQAIALANKEVEKVLKETQIVTTLMW